MALVIMATTRPGGGSPLASLSARVGRGWYSRRLGDKSQRSDSRRIVVRRCSVVWVAAGHPGSETRGSESCGASSGSLIQDAGSNEIHECPRGLPSESGDLG